MTTGDWEIDAYAPERATWIWLTMSHPAGSTAAIRLLINKERRYYWVWREHWLGRTTTLTSRGSFPSREMCVRHLVGAMRALEVALVPTELESMF